MKKLKILVIGLIAASAFFAAPQIALAQSTEELACGAAGILAPSSWESCFLDGNADAKLSNTLQRAIRMFQLVVGLVSVFMIILGGLRYITSGGDSTSINSAKNTILYAIIGLVVVAMAQVIVQFVLNRISNIGTGQI